MSETRWPGDAGVCRVAEAEKERLSVELEQVWAELSSVVRAVYHLDNSTAADTSDANRLSGLVSRQVPANSRCLQLPEISRNLVAAPGNLEFCWMLTPGNTGNLPEFSCCSWKYWKSPRI